MRVESIQTVAVLGLGTMGHGIAQTFAATGYRVRCYDELASARDGLPDRIRANLQQMAEAGLGDEGSLKETLGRITVFEDESETVRPAEFVTESVREDLGVKQELFARIESIVSPETILASNTSTYPMTEVAARTRRPERAVNTHWFNPPYIVPLVEIIPGRKTSEETTGTVLELMTKIGKTAVRLNMELPGFLVNRIQVAMIREVWDLMERGVASPEDIDRAVQASLGFRLAAIGPLEVCDFGGLDVWSRVYESLVQEIRSDRKLHSRMGELIEADRYGVKTGSGIYDYTPESAEAKRKERDRRFLALAKLLYSSA